MRKFTDKENKWIKEFVELKEKGLSHVQELQVAKILRTKFSFFALKWTYGEKPQISLYNRMEDKDKAEKQYYDICDFIYFIKELESLGFIAIQKFYSGKEDVGYNVLYDRDKYIYDEENDKFRPAECTDLSSFIPGDSSSNKFPMEQMGNGVYALFQIEQAQNINLDFAYDLQKYGLGIIYPLPLAVDYVNNNFKTLEDRYHDDEMKVALDSAEESRKAANTAFWSFIAAIVSLIVSIVIPMCSSQKIDPDQITTIEKTIKGNRIEEPLTVEIKDTILTKPVSVNEQTTSSHQQLSIPQK